MLNKLLVIPLLLTAIAGFANTQPFPGYYLDRNGDTVHCDFNFNDWNVTPESIIVTIETRTITLYPAEIGGFGVYGHGDFISANISYHHAPKSRTDIPESYTDDTINKRSFLRIIARGFYSLYELTTSNGAYYFIANDKAEPEELVYRVRQRNMTIEEDTKYRTTLFELFSKEYISYENITLINKSAYKRKDLQRLVSILNRKHPGQEYKMGGNNNDVMQLDVFVGAIRNRFPATFDGQFSTSNSLSSKISPSAGIGMLYTLPNHFHAFSVGLTAGYNGYQSSGFTSGTFSDSQSINYHSKTQYTETFELSSKFIMLNMFGVYVINPLSKTNFFLKAGANCNISIEPQKDLQNYYTSSRMEVRNGTERGPYKGEGRKLIPIRPMYFNLNADIGIINGRNKLELSYYPRVNLNPGYAFKISMIGVHYFYTFYKR